MCRKAITTLALGLAKHLKAFWFAGPRPNTQSILHIRTVAADTPWERVWGHRRKHIHFGFSSPMSRHSLKWVSVVKHTHTELMPCKMLWSCKFLCNCSSSTKSKWKWAAKDLLSWGKSLALYFRFDCRSKCRSPNEVPNCEAQLKMLLQLRQTESPEEGAGKHLALVL